MPVFALRTKRSNSPEVTDEEPIKYAYIVRIILKPCKFSTVFWPFKVGNFSLFFVLGPLLITRKIASLIAVMVSQLFTSLVEG